jgi:hypothetical protein
MVVAVAATAVYRAYFVTSAQYAGYTPFGMKQTRVHLLEVDSDPIRRDTLCLSPAAI